MRNQRRQLVTGSAFSPAQVPGMFLQLDGQAITGYNQLDPLTSWADTSGNGRHAVTTGAGVVPKYIRTATLPLGGDAGMAWFNPFDGGGSENGGPFPESTIDQGTGWTYYLWFRAFNATDFQVLWQDNVGGGQPQLLWVSTGKFGWRDAGGTHEIAAAATGYHSLIYVFAGAPGGVGTIYFDGVSAGTATWNWNDTGVTNYIMGANQVSNGNWDGWMAHVIGFVGAHGTAVRTAMRSYLVNRWGWG